MQACEIFPRLSKQLNHEVLESARLNDKKLYRRTVLELCEALRRREQAVLELPRAERHELFQAALGRAQFDVLGHNLVINWLRSGHVGMLIAFLDALGVAHDERGFSEGFPKEMAAAHLERACGALYEKFPAEQVSLYLRLFPNITGVEWDLAPFIKE